MYSNQTRSENDNSSISNLTTEQQTSKNSNEAQQQSTEKDGKTEMLYSINSTAPNQEQLQNQGQAGSNLVNDSHLLNDTATNSLHCTVNKDFNTERNETDFVTEPNRKLDNDDETDLDVISSLIGPFGRWQLLMTILLSLFQVPNTFHISSSVYQVNFIHHLIEIVFNKNIRRN